MAGPWPPLFCPLQLVLTSNIFPSGHTQEQPTQEQDRIPPLTLKLPGNTAKAHGLCSPGPCSPAHHPTHLPSEGYRVTGCCLAVCRTSRIPTTGPVFLSREIKPFSPFSKTGIEEGPHPGLPAILWKPMCPRTETRRAIKAGVKEHRRSVPMPSWVAGPGWLAGAGCPIAQSQRRRKALSISTPACPRLPRGGTLSGSGIHWKPETPQHGPTLASCAACSEKVRLPPCLPFPGEWCG